MKRKFLYAFMAVALCFSVTACGGSNNSSNGTSNNASVSEQASETPTPEPLNLDGTWVSENNNGSYQEAVISGDTIEINWVSDNGETTAIYWIGSYEAPTADIEEYSWTSTRDKEKTDNALMASTDDTKDFSYKDGELSYSVSMMGATTTLHLTKQK